MLELSTPVIQLWDGILAIPLISTLDSSRTQVVMEALLQQIVAIRSPIAILDITGVPTVDTLTARTGAGRAVVHASQFHVDGLLKALRRILQPLVPARVALRLEVEPDLRAITSEEPKLSQILRNLVGNAIKFTERGFVAIRARRGTGDADGHIVFEVEDSGIGIAPEHQELIFREFAQVDGHVAPRMRGSGLGLPLSRRLAELLGGTLWVDSRLGAGSTFQLVMPIAYGGGDVVELAALRAPALARRALRGRGGRVRPRRPEWHGAGPTRSSSTS